MKAVASIAPNLHVYKIAKTSDVGTSTLAVPMLGGFSVRKVPGQWTLSTVAECRNVVTMDGLAAHAYNCVNRTAK